MRNAIEFIKTDRFKKYFFNTGWMMVERGISLVVLFIISILIARYLGPAKFGILNYATSICLIASPLCYLGLEGIVTRDLVNNPHQSGEILGTSFTLMLAGSISAFGLIFLFLLFSNPQPEVRSLLFIIGLSLIFDSFYIFKYYYQAKVLMKYAAISMIITVLLASIFRLALIYSRQSLIWFGAAILVQKIIFALTINFFYKSSASASSIWKFNLRRANSLLRDSWPLLLSGLSVIIYMYIDQAMLMWLKGEQEVGQYAAAVKISEVCYFIPTIICSSVFPALVNIKRHNPNLYEQRLLRLYQLMILLALAIMIPITLFAPGIIRTLLGTDYMPAAQVLKIHIWSAIFVFLGVASGNYLIVENHTMTSFVRTFIGMLLNVLLNILLIPPYGIIGAAVATVISYGLATFSIIFDKNTRPQGFLMLRAFNLLAKT